MATVNLSDYSPLNLTNADEFHIGIVVSEWNDFVTFNLRDGAIDVLIKEGVKEKNIDCLSFIEYPELLMKWNISLKQFQCKNNKMVFQVQSEDFLSKVQERCGTPIEYQIKENELNVVKLVENNVLLDKLVYKNEKLDFIKIKLNQEDVIEDEFWETSNKTAKICDIREDNYQVKIKEK